MPALDMPPKIDAVQAIVRNIADEERSKSTSSIMKSINEASDALLLYGKYIDQSSHFEAAAEHSKIVKFLAFLKEVREIFVVRNEPRIVKCLDVFMARAEEAEATLELYSISKMAGSMKQYHHAKSMKGQLKGIAWKPGLML